MNNAPILILQMQRMGDLVLAFPLLGWLSRRFAGHPLWVVGEERFFNALMPLSPQATYFSYDGAPVIPEQHFHAVVNLSHRPEAASLAGKARCDALFGPYLTAEGDLHIKGDWQLYRASLTHNNRYNLFHWADLNALDLVPEAFFKRTNWPKPAPFAAPHSAVENDAPDAPAQSARIGLFLGASEVDKHPDAAFWAALAKQLLALGHRPVLLGGTAEIPLGRAVAARLKAHPLNLCGNFSVSDLARFISELDLCITPDTGPMHIAAWTGTPVLNLSMGPVNPWETGPFAPGHHIVRAKLDCVGCWRCIQPSVICKAPVQARRIAAIAEAILQGTTGPELAGTAKDLELLRTARDAHGLYTLHSVFGTAQERLAVSRLWQHWFGHVFGLHAAEEPRAAWQHLTEGHPGVASSLRDGAAALIAGLARTLRKDPGELTSNDAFWQNFPPLLRPLSGFIQMHVQNERASRPSLLRALSLAEIFRDVCV